MFSDCSLSIKIVKKASVDNDDLNSAAPAAMATFAVAVSSCHAAESIHVSIFFIKAL